MTNSRLRLSVWVFVVMQFACGGGTHEGGQQETHASTAFSPLNTTLNRCRVAIERVSDDASFDEAVNQCVRLFRLQACSDNFAVALRGAPETRSSTIASACAAAYCPVLAEPKPQLCEEPTPPAPSRLMDLYAPFTRTAHAHDWPDASFQEVLEIDRALSELVLIRRRLSAPPQPEQSAPAPTLTITANAMVMHIELRLLDGTTSSYDVPESAVPETAARLIREAPSSVGANLVIAVSGSVSYGLLTQTIDRVAAAGITNVILQSE